MPLASDPDVYKGQMKKLKTFFDNKIAAADIEKGLLIVHTGNGKGKTTAAIGMLVRCLGYGFKCAVVQFIKGAQNTSETALLNAAKSMGGSLSWDRCGDGFTWDTQDRQKDIDHAREGWEIVVRHLEDEDLRFLFLDELNIVLRHEFLNIGEVLPVLQGRHPNLHVVITGRNAPHELIEAADLVTEMKEIKHPFKSGIKAQQGIEY